MSAATASIVVGDHEFGPIGDWEQVVARAPQLAATVDAYLVELSTTSSPSSVQAASATLRQFAGYVTAVDPHCTTVASITGHHIGDYCLWLALHRDERTRRSVSARTINRRFGQLRRFFERLLEQGAADAPPIVPVPARQRGRRGPTAPQRGSRSVDITDRSVQPPPQPADHSWKEIALRAPQMAETMTAYLQQLSVSSRPGTVEAASLALRQFATHLTRTDPVCVSVAAIERRHIESFKVALAARLGRTGTVSPQTIRNRLGMLRTFFERVIDWDYPDAPRRVPVFAGDLPKADEPLPKFLDDPTAAKFMAALAVEPNRRRRLIVELLARTGMRVGELGGLRDDAMYRLGDTYWLRIPIGKLHNDRTVPLHPMLVGLINDYRSWRGPTTTGLLVERDDHQPMDPRTIYRQVKVVARRAGVGHVHPHALRHTLATQCLNRGMSLEAIAALLGHRSPRMTLVYARISDTTVAEQYFTATGALEAVGHTTPPNDDAVRHAAQLHRRLLGNGHCTRPLELDCRFQTICEGCGFFHTGPEFVTILRRQRDDATAHNDHPRTNLYDDLIRVIDETETSSTDDRAPKPGSTIA
jgi:site-specific recombinase XerD